MRKAGEGNNDWEGIGEVILLPGNSTFLLFQIYKALTSLIR